MKLLLFAGAGTSIELGIPGMYGLGTEFRSYLRQSPAESTLVSQLTGNNVDVEHLIEEIDRLCDARTPLEALVAKGVDVDSADRVRAEVEWFVQHAAERVVEEDASIMWAGILRCAPSTDITFVTTNYDRAIEIAARHEEIHLDDAFPPFATDGTALWSGFAQTSPRPLLVKLHGSTDWYVDGRTGKPAKLRHPMPLFGRATLRLSEGRELSSALVLPSREKLLTRTPYPRLSQRFYNAADACDLAVCVGSSLRDEHVREAIRSTAHNVPTFVVNPQGENCGIEEAFAIGQHASTFLISTLPNALLTDNPAAVLHGASRETQRASPGLLEAARNLLDTRAATVQRCQSADEFEKVAAALHPAFLAKLLDDDSPTVARYALGLLAVSPMVVQLMERADRSRHIGDEDFRTDLNLLRKMIQSQSSTAVALASAP